MLILSYFSDLNLGESYWSHHSALDQHDLVLKNQ